MSNAVTAKAGYLTFTVLPPPFLSPPQTIRHSRPGLLKAGDPGLPWLADSWPSTSLPANGGLGSPKGGSNFGRGGKKHKQAGGGGGEEGRGLTGERTVLATPGGTVLMLIRREEQWQDVTRKHARTQGRARAN